MLTASNRGGKEVEIATVFQFQALSEFGYRQGKIAHGDIGSVDTSEGSFQLAFVHRSGLFDSKAPTRKIAAVFVGNKQMAVLIKLGNIESLL